MQHDKPLMKLIHVLLAIWVVFGSEVFAQENNRPSGKPLDGAAKKLAYIVSDARIPFWQIMTRGIKNSAKELGYEVEIYSAENNA